MNAKEYAKSLRLIADFYEWDCEPLMGGRVMSDEPKTCEHHGQPFEMLFGEWLCPECHYEDSLRDKEPTLDEYEQELSDVEPAHAGGRINHNH